MEEPSCIQEDITRMDTDSTNTEKKNTRGKARARPHENHYKGIKFSPVEPSSKTERPEPGEPLRFFSSSYDVEFLEDRHQLKTDVAADVVSDNNDRDKTSTTYPLKQVVHRHANGLVVVTAGSTLQSLQQNANEDSMGQPTRAEIDISTFKFILEVSKSQSVGGKRKRARKMKKKGGNKNDTVEPNDTIAVATLSNGQEIEFKCCVTGTLLEINERLLLPGDKDDNRNGDPSLLTKDPLLDGYLAVIMPSTFPSTNG